MKQLEQGKDKNSVGKDTNIERKMFVERQMANGMIILYPKDNELLIDIDSLEQYSVFENGVEILRRNTPKDNEPWIFEEWISPSGFPRRHIRVTLPFNISSPYERIAYQAAMGSDPSRELLSLIRCSRGDVSPTLLVEKEDK